MKQRVHNVWTSMMMIAAVGPAHQGRMWKHLEWANWFWAAEATLGRPPIPRQQGSGNDGSWMVVNVTDRFLKRHNFYNRAIVDEMNRRPCGLLQTIIVLQWNPRRCRWLRYCAIRRKVAGSIPDSVIGIFPSDSASNRSEYQEYFLEVEAAGAWGWQIYHIHVPTDLKSGSLITPGNLRACPGLLHRLLDLSPLPMK